MIFIVIILSITAMIILLSAVYYTKKIMPFNEFFKIVIALALAAFIIIAIYLTITMLSPMLDIQAKL
ncbi:MAG: hypothetical protein SOR72_04325 [Hornefia sp.]|nr:hypothetical protein [Hornefia sp.]